MTEPVIIEDYNPRWHAQSEIVRSRLQRVLGPLAAAIEHVGSTAVPGLPAKPIIDMDILLKPDTELTAAITRLASLGYQHQGDLGIAGRQAFRPPAEDFPHHLYACPCNSAEFRRHITFRDHLRTNPKDADAYARLKRELAAKFATDREGYCRAKTSFVEQILAGNAAAATEHFPVPKRTIP
jgi:GrpB-like predicted nucleotidyltransferase (UPF0157 family)